MYYHILNKLYILGDFTPGAVMTIWVMSIMEMLGVFDGCLHTVIGNALIIGGGIYYINNGMSFYPKRVNDKKEMLDKFMGMMSHEIDKAVRDHVTPPAPPSTPEELLPFDNDEIKAQYEFLQKMTVETDRIAKNLQDIGAYDDSSRIDDEESLRKRSRSPGRVYEPKRSRSRSRSRDKNGDEDCVHDTYRVIVGYDDKYNRCKKCGYETAA